MTEKINPVYNMPANEYNQKLAYALKQIPEFQMPEWAAFVKTGVAKDRPPVENDFWHKRAASILKQIYINKVVGVNRLRTRYGSRKNRGMQPDIFKKASGKIIRVILQQAEQAGLLEKYNVSGKRAGRKITNKGKELLEGIDNKSIKEKSATLKISNEEPNISNPAKQTKDSTKMSKSSESKELVTPKTSNENISGSSEKTQKDIKEKDTERKQE